MAFMCSQRKLKLLNKYLSLDVGDLIELLPKFCLCIWKSIDIYCHLMPAVFLASQIPYSKILPYQVDSWEIIGPHLQYR